MSSQHGFREAGISRKGGGGKFAAFALLTLAMALGPAAIAQADDGGDAGPQTLQTTEESTTTFSTQNKNDHDKIQICHVRESRSNPYGSGLISVDANSILRDHGHAEHQENGKSDIIPPFWYVRDHGEYEFSQPGHGHRFNGKNWNEAGQATWKNDCLKPETPTINATTSDHCLVAEHPGDFAIEVALGSLQDDRSYTVKLKKGGETVGEAITFTAHSSHKSLSMPVSSAGEYTVTVTGPGETGLNAMVKVTVNDCPVKLPPTVELSSQQMCLSLSPDAMYSIIADFAALKDGEDYTVTISGPSYESDEESTFTASDSTKQMTFWVDMQGTYTVTITDSGKWPKSASDDIDVVTCAPPTQPSKPSTQPTVPTLAVTGGGDSGLAAWGGAFAILIAVTLVAADTWRRRAQR